MFIYSTPLQIMQCSPTVQKRSLTELLPLNWPQCMIVCMSVCLAIDLHTNQCPMPSASWDHNPVLQVMDGWIGDPSKVNIDLDLNWTGD